MHQQKSAASRLSRFLSSVVPAALVLSMAAGIGAGAQTLSDAVSAQIAELQAIKASLSPAEQKMSSHLVLLSRAAHGQLPADLQYLVNKTNVDAQGNAKLVVDTYSTGRFGATIDPRSLADIASNSDVKGLRDPERAHTNVGSLTSQGYVAHGANKVVAGGVNGTGVRVGVLSDSAHPARVAALIASGDLPSDVVVLPGQAGPPNGEDEGTAMMEIVHDIAPGAKLFFASAFNGEESFAQNILDLRNVYHCDIIVDDVSYFDEPAFQDGIIAKAVNTVTAAGALYFSSAANSGNLTSGTSGTWEGDFKNGGNALTNTGIESGQVHNFKATGTQIYDVLTASTTFIGLHWSDPVGNSTNDYDLFLLTNDGSAIVDYSYDTQNGLGSNPFEGFYNENGYAAGDLIVVIKYSGAARALHLDTERGQLSIATNGATFGHNAAASTFTTAAIYWNAAKRGPIPFLGGASNPDELFSSDGPRKIFFRPDGTPITAGNFRFATAGGTTLTKPDAGAADGVSTATPGFNPFFGTSAAAPHAAGIAALVKSARPALTNTQIRNILTSTAVDNMGSGIDRDSGYGILQAVPAVNAAKNYVLP